jgi:hypothetical protein
MRSEDRDAISGAYQRPGEILDERPGGIPGEAGIGLSEEE